MSHAATEPQRPALRWHGGKWLLAPWIISHFPPHRVYVEPFGGAASVLIRKPRVYAEIYNDLDDEVVTLFRVLRGARSQELVDALRLTPFARLEFEETYETATGDIEIARRLIARSFMGFGSNGHNKANKTGFRANSNRSGTTPARDWCNYPDALNAIIERFAGVVVEKRDAMTVMAAHDGPDTLHYVDPPYLPETRSQKMLKSGGRHHAYNNELTESDHVLLLDGLKDLAGAVVLSGYPSQMYDAALEGWTRIDRDAFADGARARTEVLWINAQAAAAMGGGAKQESMF